MLSRNEVRRLDTLWEEAVTTLPNYPTFSLLTANGGEITYEIDPFSTAAQTDFHWQNWSLDVPILQRRADKGELLRTPDLKFIPDYTKNMAYRLKIQELCKESDHFKKLQWGLCKSSILYFCNTFGYVHEPRRSKNRSLPFVTFEFQDEILQWQLWLIANKQSGVLEKSRDMGASWMVEYVDVWLAIFQQESTTYQMSMTEAEVDNRLPDSLLGKARFVVEALPTWLRAGWGRDKQGMDNLMKLYFPKTKSSIQGRLTQGSSGRAGGRGGRALRLTNDEAAFIDGLDVVGAAQSEVADSIFYASTPNGHGNFFFKMRDKSSTDVRTLHWTQHPMKNPDWAKYRRSQPYYSNETWAQEQECSYEGSVEGKVFSMFTEFRKNEYEWSHAQSGEFYEYDPSYDVLAAMDLGVGDPTALIFAQVKPAPLHFEGRVDNCLVIFEEHQKANMHIEYWIDYLIAKGYKYRFIIMDNRTGNQRWPNMMTWFKYFESKGLPSVGQNSSELQTLEKTKLRLNKRGAFAVNKDNCQHLIKAMHNWSYDLDPETRLPKPGGKPRHDQWSHKMKALLYLIDYIDGMPEPDVAPQNFVWDSRVITQNKFI